MIFPTQSHAENGYWATRGAVLMHLMNCTLSEDFLFSLVFRKIDKKALLRFSGEGKEELLNFVLHELTRKTVHS